jgi:hypothetical protein
MGTYNGEPIVTIYDLLDIVRERPGMWIGSPNIEYLFVWIQGVHAGAHIAGDPLTGGTPDFHGSARTGRAASTTGWSAMLLDACGGDTESAFERFWLVLDAFRAAGGRVH